MASGGKGMYKHDTSAAFLKVAEDGTVMERVTHVRYIDRFEERNGEWRIQKRLVSYDWSTVTPVTGTNLMQPSFLTGKRAPDDAWNHILD